MTPSVTVTCGTVTVTYTTAWHDIRLTHDEFLIFLKIK